MHDLRDSLVTAAAARWPDHAWHDAGTHRGAFHLVLTAPGGPTVRAALGRDGHERSRREARILHLMEEADCPVTIPRILDGPHPVESSGSWMSLVTTAPGSPTSDLFSCPDSRIAAYAGTLAAWRATPPARIASLPPVRAWCGGEYWPDIVRENLAPLMEAPVAAIAAERIESVLEAESDVEPSFCHGDFGPHNILWEGSFALSVIDLDHACLGDPAIDLAPLISFHGASRAAALGSREEIRRAMLHRATLPLQVAAAAHGAGLYDLRSHALDSFARRVAAGTLFDPGGRTPE